jgi:hypothetical protein
LTIYGLAGVTAGGVFCIPITAFDPYGNVATGYNGTVHFASSDSTATLPVDYTFAGDQGVHYFCFSLYKKGTQTITVTDTLDTMLTDSLSLNVI